MRTASFLFFLSVIALSHAQRAHAAFYVDEEASVKTVPLPLISAPSATPARTARFIAPSRSTVPVAPQKSLNSSVKADTDQPLAWTLTADRSLRENLDGWARRAGYHALEWKTSYVGPKVLGSAYTGSFLDALQRIAERTPELDFLISERQRIVRVVDAGSSTEKVAMKAAP